MINIMLQAFIFGLIKSRIFIRTKKKKKKKNLMKKNMKILLRKQPKIYKKKFKKFLRRFKRNSIRIYKSLSFLKRKELSVRYFLFRYYNKKKKRERFVYTKKKHMRFKFSFFTATYIKKKLAKKVKYKKRKNEERFKKLKSKNFPYFDNSFSRIYTCHSGIIKNTIKRELFWKQKKKKNIVKILIAKKKKSIICSKFENIKHVELKKDLKLKKHLTNLFVLRYKEKLLDYCQYKKQIFKLKKKKKSLLLDLNQYFSKKNRF